jgi:hypothetical protein
MPPGNTCLVFSMEEIEQQVGEDKLLKGVQLFANETWFCIQSLLLAHVTVIQMYCVSKGESISLQTMNSDTVEWFVGDARQMVGGRSNKLTAAGFDRADKKASTFNAAKFALVGNNSTGGNMFGRNKRF